MEWPTAAHNPKPDALRGADVDGRRVDVVHGT